MRVLLDTHVFLWALQSPEHLGPRALALLTAPTTQCWLSAAGLWEIAIKVRQGRLPLRQPLPTLVTAAAELGVQVLEVSGAHALATATVDLPTADPFDRMLVAQCEVETLRLLTADRALLGLPVAIAAGA